MDQMMSVFHDEAYRARAIIIYYEKDREVVQRTMDEIGLPGNWAKLKSKLDEMNIEYTAWEINESENNTEGAVSPAPYQGGVEGNDSSVNGNDASALPLGPNSDGVAPSVTLVFTDYHVPGQERIPYRGVLYDPTSDKMLDGEREIVKLCDLEGIKDGDEFELAVRRTGRRPFGDRRVMLVKPNTYEREEVA
jgi:hypothetical protein